jgi:hypothetical protein
MYNTPHQTGRIVMGLRKTKDFASNSADHGADSRYGGMVAYPGTTDEAMIFSKAYVQMNPTRAQEEQAKFIIANLMADKATATLVCKGDFLSPHMHPDYPALLESRKKKLSKIIN